MQKIRIELTQAGGQIFNTNNRLISISPVTVTGTNDICTLYDFKRELITDGNNVNPGEPEYVDTYDAPVTGDRILYKIGGNKNEIHLSLDLPFRNGLYAVWTDTPTSYTANVMLG